MRKRPAKAKAQMINAFVFAGRFPYYIIVTLLIPQMRVVERHEHTLVDGIAAVGQYYFNFTVAFAVVDHS